MTYHLGQFDWLVLDCLLILPCGLSASLLHRDTLGQVPRLVHIRAPEHGDVVDEQLERDGEEHRGDHGIRRGDLNHVIGNPVDRFARARGSGLAMPHGARCLMARPAPSGTIWFAEASDAGDSVEIPAPSRTGAPLQHKSWRNRHDQPQSYSCRLGAAILLPLWHPALSRGAVLPFASYGHAFLAHILKKGRVCLQPIGLFYTNR